MAEAAIAAAAEKKKQEAATKSGNGTCPPVKKQVTTGETVTIGAENENPEIEDSPDANAEPFSLEAILQKIRAVCRKTGGRVLGYIEELAAVGYRCEREFEIEIQILRSLNIFSYYQPFVVVQSDNNDVNDSQGGGYGRETRYNPRVSSPLPRVDSANGCGVYRGF